MMTHALLRKATLWTLLAGSLALGLGGCFEVTAPDLFLLQRTGAGRPFSILVNDGGLISCNGGHFKHLPDPVLLQARDLAMALETYVHAGQTSNVPGNSVFRYRVELPDGTVIFPDTAAGHRAVFAQTVQFALQTAQHVCHIRT
jgi:hypothetical protein